MSFRIDDILKKEDVKSASSSSPEGGLEGEGWCGRGHKSILQQTLLNRAQHPYPGKHELQKWENWYGYGLPHGYFGNYMEKANLYGSFYQRTRLWPSIYPSPFPVVLPMHYAHYSKRKGGQVRFTAGQTDALEKRFTSHKYLSPEDRRLLADSLKLTDRQVKTWFQNRRAKWRRCNNSAAVDTTENIEESDTEPEISETGSEQN